MLPSNNSMTSTHNNSMVHMSEYTPTAIQDLSVLVSVVPADQLYLSVSPTGASDSNNNSMTGMLGGNLYNNNGSMNNASMLGNNSIVFNNNSSIAVSRLPFGPSLLGTTPNALPGSSALLGT
ncbi:hypothetical protein AGDE_15731 [Angomonas deanei]|uniref:Uncharacterized protein n=1 Tax=Angomonas deanei TaxID=59799 RepID=A0A7G2CTA0_9TRYP|nr:hypothetical protein AGDE_15731 [Angomonas deanei]CAD2222164.1 hypothetical protein, conserved [Angomonas deanei]|eukprot:EPY18565.1 hypothetical protein AGDE_15731 [Angomonas deanei]